MTKLIIGATGSIGSALSRKLAKDGNKVHIVGRNEGELKALANEIGSTFTVADVLTENYSEQVIKDVGENLDGLAFCVGSIDLNPLNKKSDYMQSFNLNLISATEIIRGHRKLKLTKVQ